MKQMPNGTNKGLNNIETYSQVLKSRDFAETISKVQVPNKGMTYREYLDTDDALNAITDKIEYNIRRKSEELTIGFTDKDPLVAAQMLDSVVVHLQNFIIANRHKMDNHAMQNAKDELEEETKRYREAQRVYTDFSDSHLKSLSMAERQREVALQKEVALSYQHYKSALQQYVRHQMLTERPYASFAVVKSNTVPLERKGFFLSYFFSFVIIALASVKAYRLFRHRQQESFKLDFGGVFAPWNLSLLVWLGILILFLFFGDELYPVTKKFYIAISLWLSLLVLSSLVTYNLMEHRVVAYKPIEINRYIFYFFFFLSVCLSPMYLYHVWKIVAMFDSKDIMSDIRTLSVAGENIGSLYYAIVLAPSLLLVVLWRYPKVPLWQVIVIITCCIINALAIMEKGTIFLVVLSSIYVLYERHVIKLRTIGVTMTILLVLFFFFNLMRGGEESEYSQNETFLGFIAMYVMSPPVAFCTVMEDVTNNFGANSLTIPYSLLARFNIAHFEMTDKLQEFVCVPVYTNVYTIMQPFYRDFGYGGVAFFAWLYGIVCGALYRMSKNGNACCICLYTYAVYVLILQFFQENVFISGMYVVLLSFCVYLCTQTKFSISLGSKNNNVL